MRAVSLISVRCFLVCFTDCFMPRSLLASLHGRKVMVRGDPTIKMYRRVGKKRYLRGKHVYVHERICVPIPSRLHNKVKPFLNHRLRITIANQNSDLVINLHPVKTFRHAELPPAKTSPKHNHDHHFKHENAVSP